MRDMFRQPSRMSTFDKLGPARTCAHAREKAAFIGLVLSHGWRYLEQWAGVAVTIDLVVIGLFACYWLAGMKESST